MDRISKIYNMNKYKIREYIHLSAAILFIWLYILHFIALASSPRSRRYDLFLDIDRLHLKITRNRYIKLLWFIHNDGFFRELFYYRIGAIRALPISWIRPSANHFHIAKSMPMKGGAYFPHPYATYVHARSIGANFSCRNCTTIGKTDKGNPIIGNNVTVGANCVIIGNITIGDNVVIGAGSVVNKSIPSNCIIAGVPAKVIRQL